MADRSHIEWTEATWNPIAGCSIVSPGCKVCYAMRRVAPRLAANPATPHYAGTVKPSKAGPVWTGKIGIAADEVFTKPLRWKRPRMIFVNSTSDLFHEAVPDEVIDRIFAVMALCPQHTFQILTKRSARMQEYLSDESLNERISVALGNMLDGAWIWNEGKRYRDEIERMIGAFAGIDHDDEGNEYWPDCPMPLPNVWLGVSAEDQARADERVPDLLATPAAIRFVSAEPLLGPIQFDDFCNGYKFIDALRGNWWHDDPDGPNPISRDHEKLDWVIVGGESGTGARPMHPDWARSIRDQCEAAGVPFFFKQWGEWLPNFESSFAAFDLPTDDPEQCRYPTCVWNDGTKRWEPTNGSWTDPENWLIADNYWKPEQPMTRYGKRFTGRLLEGIEHNGMPKPREVPAL